MPHSLSALGVLRENPSPRPSDLNSSSGRDKTSARPEPQFRSLTPPFIGNAQFAINKASAERELSVHNQTALRCHPFILSPTLGSLPNPIPDAFEFRVSVFGFAPRRSLQRAKD